MSDTKNIRLNVGVALYCTTFILSLVTFGYAEDSGTPWILLTVAAAFHGLFVLFNGAACYLFGCDKDTFQPFNFESGKPIYLICLTLDAHWLLTLVWASYYTHVNAANHNFCLYLALNTLMHSLANSFKIYNDFIC